MAEHKISVGNVEVVSVLDGYSVKRVPTEIFPDSSMEGWREYPDVLDENDQIQSRYGSVALHSRVSSFSWTQACRQTPAASCWTI